MATRRLATKQRRAGVKPEIWAWMIDENPRTLDEEGNFSFDIFLLDGQWIHHHGDDRDELLKLWREVEADVLGYWIPLHPGTRPRLWWQYSAPRIPAGSWDVVADTYMDGALPEPRLQISGAPSAPSDTGLNVCPWFECGLPRLWQQGFDAGDPPTFESQATYLKRHGLLTREEQRQLSEQDFKPEVMTSEQFNDCCAKT